MFGFHHIYGTTADSLNVFKLPNSPPTTPRGPSWRGTPGGQRAPEPHPEGPAAPQQVRQESAHVTASDKNYCLPSFRPTALVLKSSFLPSVFLLFSDAQMFDFKCFSLFLALLSFTRPLLLLLGSSTSRGAREREIWEKSVFAARVRVVRGARAVGVTNGGGTLLLVRSAAAAARGLSIDGSPPLRLMHAHARAPPASRQKPACMMICEGAPCSLARSLDDMTTVDLAWMMLTLMLTVIP